MIVIALELIKQRLDAFGAAGKSLLDKAGELQLTGLGLGYRFSDR